VAEAEGSENSCTGNGVVSPGFAVASKPFRRFAHDADDTVVGFWVNLSFGYPEKPEALTWPKGKGRKTLEEVVHYERW
jgi:hypothetical protein